MIGTRDRNQELRFYAVSRAIWCTFGAPMVHRPESNLLFGRCQGVGSLAFPNAFSPMDAPPQRVSESRFTVRPLSPPVLEVLCHPAQLLLTGS